MFSKDLGIAVKPLKGVVVLTKNIGWSSKVEAIEAYIGNTFIRCD